MSGKLVARITRCEMLLGRSCDDDGDGVSGLGVESVAGFERDDLGANLAGSAGNEAQCRRQADSGGEPAAR